MKHILLLLLFLSGLLGSESYAQQDKLFTQTLNYPSSLNPAYVGSASCSQILALYRNQWQGISGAPESTVLSGNTYLELFRIGLGATLELDKTGPAKSTDVALDASYRIPVSRKVNMALGLKSTLSFKDIDYAFIRDNVPDEGDELLEKDISGEAKPNFGVGIYFFSPKFYAGISVPKLLKEATTIVAQREELTLQNAHYYFMGGLWLELNPMIQLKPSVVVRMVKGVPLSFDLNLSAFFLRKLWVGGSYRLDDAVSAILQYQIDESLRLGYSYDITTSRLNIASNGSHEVSLRYDFLFKAKKIKSPRYF
ncbi:MAG: type IX secretion system membrane protein PorP/SprF [Cytophagales bacterium]|nr:type IX secretion system membrane protein PorP/SprF [Cytophagales bacterium]